MKTARLLLVLSIVLAACGVNRRAGLTPAAECGIQVGMTGELPTDIVGTWKWSWSGPADGGPASRLLEFRAGGSARTVGGPAGLEQWSYRVVDSEVWMSGADPSDDLQSLRTLWAFDGAEWNIASNKPYGDSTLDWCPPRE